MSGTWHEDWSPSSMQSEDGAAERRVMLAAFNSFRQYRRLAHYNITHRRRQNFYALPQAHWQLLSEPPFNILQTLDRVDDAIDENARIASQIASHATKAFSLQTGASNGQQQDGAQEYDAVLNNEELGSVKTSDVDKARYTIRQFYRDWSAEAAKERAACFKPVFDTLNETYSDPQARDTVRVLIPGAGLGRLVVELCAMGFEVEGNEISFHQLLASNWILNGTSPDTTFSLYPWALSFSNHQSRDKQLRRVTIPDVHPGTYLHEASQGKPRHAFERISMSAADFCVLYAEPNQKHSFDVVATVYFIDTAPNLIRYVEAIYNTLKPGGLWINIGPLLWHFEDRAPGDNSNNGQDITGGSGMGDDDTQDQGKTSENGHHHHHQQGIGESGSVELSADEVVALVEHMGMTVHQTRIISSGSGNNDAHAHAQGYINDAESMVTTSYKHLFFVATKPPASSTAE